MTMERDSLVARLEAIAEHRCLHDLGVDRETGPLGCALDAMPGSSCICAGIVPTVREAAAALSRHEQVVKALEWVWDGPNHWKAGAITGSYHIVFENDAFRLRLSWSLMKDDGVFDSIDAAKAAAQSDYAQRILSALHPAPEAASAGAAETVIGDERIFPNEPFGSDTAPSPKGVSDGVRAALTAWRLREWMAAQGWHASLESVDLAIAALSQEPIPATAEERAASKEGA